MTAAATEAPSPLQLTLEGLLAPIRAAWLRIPAKPRKVLVDQVVDVAGELAELVKLSLTLPNKDEWESLGPSFMQIGGIVRGYGDEGQEALEAACARTFTDLRPVVQKIRALIKAAAGK